MATTMRRHQDWASPGFLLPPVAHSIGPFGLAGFLSALWATVPECETELALVESESALIPLAVGHGRAGFVGHRDLVDYRSPLGTGTTDLMAQVVSSLPSGTRVVFDSLPAEAVQPIAGGLAAAGLDVDPVAHEVAAVLLLPESFDDYLGSIAKKERHELRRKRRRYEAVTGSAQLTRQFDDPDTFGQFVALHRRAAGDKGSFMTREREDFFRSLLAVPGWEINALLDQTGRVAAAAFGFVDEDGYYLYNSAYDPDLRELSPGQVMLGLLIERAINEGKHVFDFLKGDEAYKFKLGASPRSLFEIVTIT